MKKKKNLLREIANEAERAAINAAIAQHGTRGRAAKSLGISTVTLRAKIGAGR